MYLEQLVIDDYLIKKQQFDGMSEEEQWEHEEPIPPDAYLRDEYLTDEQERAILPDVLDM